MFQHDKKIVFKQLEPKNLPVESVGRILSTAPPKIAGKIEKKIRCLKWQNNSFEQPSKETIRPRAQASQPLFSGP